MHCFPVATVSETAEHWRRNSRTEPNNSGHGHDALERGAKVINEGGGKIVETFFHPAVVYPLNASMKLYGEEQFGPIVPIALPLIALAKSLRKLDSPYCQRSGPAGKHLP